MEQIRSGHFCEYCKSYTTPFYDKELRVEICNKCHAIQGGTEEHKSISDQFRERLEKLLKCDCTNFWQKSHCTTCKEDLIDDIMDAYNEVHK